METFNTRYIIDEKGQKSAVVLPIEAYQRILEGLEELEDIRLYEEAKAAQEPSVPIDEAFRIIETQRSKKG